MFKGANNSIIYNNDFSYEKDLLPKLKKLFLIFYLSKIYIIIGIYCLRQMPFFPTLSWFWKRFLKIPFTIVILIFSLGKRNYRYFYLFLVSLSFHCVFIFTCSLTHLVLRSKEINPEKVRLINRSDWWEWSF